MKFTKHKCSVTFFFRPLLLVLGKIGTSAGFQMHKGLAWNKREYHFNIDYKVEYSCERTKQT